MMKNPASFHDLAALAAQIPRHNQQASSQSEEREEVDGYWSNPEDSVFKLAVDGDGDSQCSDSNLPSPAEKNAVLFCSDSELP